MQNESHLLRHEQDRTEEFRPNPKLVAIIKELRELLEPIQSRRNQGFHSPVFPVIAVVGCSRTGSTLLTQLMASTGCFAYPTNFLSRFAYAPQIGAMIQQMLFNPAFDFRGELSDIQSALNLNSMLGKTTGALNVNEFFHFWRRFFPIHDPDFLDSETLGKVQIKEMRKELASIESVFGKPFMGKGKMMQQNLAYFAKHMPELFFIHIKRQPEFVMQSILLSRRKFYGNDKVWWAIKPKEYDLLAKMDPYHQIAGQAYFLTKAIDKELSEVGDNHQLTLYYEDLCREPNFFLRNLQDKLKKLGYDPGAFEKHTKLACSNKLKISKDELLKLKNAYHRFASNDFVNH